MCNDFIARQIASCERKGIALAVVAVGLTAQ
jgi:hypothetical protein